jgi:3-oxoacyl-[acyl-carrier-protein] synthase II
MVRVGIIGAGLLSSGGPTLSRTWKFLLEGKCSRSELPEAIAKYVQVKQGHSVRIPNVPSLAFRLAVMAKRAADEALGVGDPDLDALCIGSTSAAFYEIGSGLNLQPHYLADYLGDTYNIPDRFQTSQACASSSHAIALATDLIRSGTHETILAGGADELAPCVVAAFEAARAYSDECKPFDKGRQGLTLGEAAAFVVLAPGESSDLCFIDGIGLTCDAYDSVAPSASGITQAIVNALSEAKAESVDLIIAHGTGTKLNDLEEATAILAATQWMGIKCPPVASYKGSLGHPQGASGAVSIALATKAFEWQTIFPTVGLTNLDPKIALTVYTKPTPARLDRILCLSYGSWGTNAAILLTRKGV